MSHAGSMMGHSNENQSESLNKMMLAARSRPHLFDAVISSFEIMSRQHIRIRADIASQDGRSDAKARLSPRTREDLEHIIHKSASITLISTNGYTARVKSSDMTKDYNVVLVSDPESGDTTTCTCGMMNVTELLCKHVCKAAAHLELNAYELQAVRFPHTTFQAWEKQRQWSGAIVPDSATLSAAVQREDARELPQAPLRPSQAGRPRTTRAQSVLEGSTGRKSMRCSICQQPGHNRLTCSRRNTTPDAPPAPLSGRMEGSPSGVRQR